MDHSQHSSDNSRYCVCVCVSSSRSESVHTPTPASFYGKNRKWVIYDLYSLVRFLNHLPKFFATPALTLSKCSNYHSVISGSLFGLLIDARCPPEIRLRGTDGDNGVFVIVFLVLLSYGGELLCNFHVLKFHILSLFKKKRRRRRREEITAFQLVPTSQYISCLHSRALK